MRDADFGPYPTYDSESSCCWKVHFVQAPGPLPPPDSPRRGILWRCQTPRRQIPGSPRNRPIRRPELLGVSGIPARASASPGRRAILINDNAKHYRTRLFLPWRDQQARVFAIDFLPPYSPELNPIARVWKLICLALHNRYFDSSKRSSKRLRSSSKSGDNPTIPWVVYAQSFTTLCLARRFAGGRASVH